MSRPYCTPSDVRMALTAVPVDQTDGTTAAGLSDTVLQDAIAEASNEINGKLSLKYAVPVADDALAASPEPLRSWCRTIAAYYATLSWRRGQDLASDDPVIRRYTSVLNQLAEVRDGQAVLPYPTPQAVGTDTQAAQVFNQYAGSMFGPGDFSLKPRTPYPGWTAGTWPSYGEPGEGN